MVVVAAVIAVRVWLAVVVVVVIVIVIWVARRGPDGSSTDSGGAQAWAVSAIISATVGAAAIRYPAASCYGASARAAKASVATHAIPSAATVAREIAPRYDMAFPFHKDSIVALHN